MRKLYFIISCLVNSFTVFGCCGSTEKKKFKKLVCECFGIKESDIVGVYYGYGDRDFETYIEQEASDEVLNCRWWIKHKVCCYLLVCFIRSDINPDLNKVRLINSSSEKKKDLHKGFSVCKKGGVEDYYELKKFDNFRKDSDS